MPKMQAEMLRRLADRELIDLIKALVLAAGGRLVVADQDLRRAPAVGLNIDVTNHESTVLEIHD